MLKIILFDNNETYVYVTINIWKKTLLEFKKVLITKNIYEKC